MSWTQLNGKSVVVTGGACGIGLAVAKGFVEVGANVVLADFAEEQGQAAVKELADIGSGEALFVKCDVTSKADAEKVVSTAVERFGRLDVLVNTAGINVPRLLVDPAGKEELTEEIWDKVFSVNVKGQFLCAQAAARAMLRDGQGGTATKAANHNLTRSWAKELGKQGIRVVGVAPGIMETSGMRSEAYEESLAYTRGLTVEELRSKYGSTSSIPMGRSGKLGEVADLVVYLASARASYVLGTTINLSGGKSRG